jgi:hypothetical protein
MRKLKKQLATKEQPKDMAMKCSTRVWRVQDFIGGGYGGYRGEAKCPNGTERKKMSDVRG